MTYCLAMRLADGMVFLSDTRTNAGLDNIGTYRKLHVLDAGPDRTFVLQSAGNLSTTQQVLDRIRRDLDEPANAPDGVSLATVSRLHEAALYIGELSHAAAAEHSSALRHDGVDPTSTFILGGQIGHEPGDILLIYPQGNYIRASEDRPFLQIGETKYGKFALELATVTEVDLEHAARIALASMMSTAHANLSVGPPYDLAIYQEGSFSLEELRIDADSPYLDELRTTWQRLQLAAIAALPPLTRDQL